jgi:HEAT repeat protein
LLPLLGDKAELVRREAAYALGAVGSPAAVNPLLQILERDKVLEVRGAAAVALGQIGDVSAVPALMRILRNRPREREEFIRRSAAKSIGQIAQAAQFHEITFNAPKSFLPDKYKIFQYPRYEYLIEKHPVFYRSGKRFDSNSAKSVRVSGRKTRSRLRARRNRRSGGASRFAGKFQ